MTVPSPQPGKFPIVFQTGAGEPSRDAGFCLDGIEIGSVLKAVPSRFTTNPKYAQFKAHSEIDDSDFQKNLVTSSLLRLAQQIVHSHVNMGLPQGDFAPIASSDVMVPASLSAYIGQFGEFSVPELGTRFLLNGYEDTVKRLIWAADQVNRHGPNGVLHRLWLPMSSSDHSTRTVIAERLNRVLLGAELTVPANVLEDAVFSGTVPDAWESIKSVLGNPPDDGETDPRDRFDFVFKHYADAPTFVAKFTEAASAAVLRELELPWMSPSAGHVNWQYNVKESFTRLADMWAKLSAAYAQFFELSAGQSVRTSAEGSVSQMVKVSSVEGVTVLKTHLALSAPQFSLAACFPATAVFSGDLTRKVVMTTPLSVSQRATEFCQLDWR